MQINPLQALQLVKMGRNPNEIIEQLAKVNPQYKAVIDSMRNKNPQELKEYVENLAKERGINLEDFINKNFK